MALWDGRDFVTPGDVRAVLVPALAHRLLLRTSSQGAFARDEAGAPAGGARPPDAGRRGEPMTLRRRLREPSGGGGPPRRLRVTRVGRTYLVITLGIGLGALNTGNNLLYLVLGFLLSVIVLSGVLSERVLRDVTVRRLLPDGAFAARALPPALRGEPRQGPRLRAAG